MIDCAYKETPPEYNIVVVNSWEDPNPFTENGEHIGALGVADKVLSDSGYQVTALGAAGLGATVGVGIYAANKYKAESNSDLE